MRIVWLSAFLLTLPLEAAESPAPSILQKKPGAILSKVQKKEDLALARIQIRNPEAKSLTLQDLDVTFLDEAGKEVAKASRVYLAEGLNVWRISKEGEVRALFGRGVRPRAEKSEKVRYPIFGTKYQPGSVKLEAGQMAPGLYALMKVKPGQNEPTTVRVVAKTDGEVLSSESKVWWPGLSIDETRNLDPKKSVSVLGRNQTDTEYRLDLAITNRGKKDLVIGSIQAEWRAGFLKLAHRSSAHHRKTMARIQAEAITIPPGETYGILIKAKKHQIHDDPFDKVRLTITDSKTGNAMKEELKLDLPKPQEKPEKSADDEDPDDLD